MLRFKNIYKCLNLLSFLFVWPRPNASPKDSFWRGLHPGGQKGTQKSPPAALIPNAFGTGKGATPPERAVRYGRVSTVNIVVCPPLFTNRVMGGR